MSTKRVLLVVLVASGVMLAVRGDAVCALPWGPAADESGRAPAGPSALAAPPMSDEIVIAEPIIYAGGDMAYNSKHDEYLVVWLDFRIISAHRVSSRGELLGNEFSIASHSDGMGAPSVAYDPVYDRYLVVWGRESFPNNYDFYGRLVPWTVCGATEEADRVALKEVRKWVSRQVKSRQVHITPEV